MSYLQHITSLYYNVIPQIACPYSCIPPLPSLSLPAHRQRYRLIMRQIRHLVYRVRE